jgi:hypothetical protein
MEPQKRVPATAPPGRHKFFCFLFEFSELDKGSSKLIK